MNNSYLYAPSIRSFWIHLRTHIARMKRASRRPLEPIRVQAASHNELLDCEETWHIKAPADACIDVISSYSVVPTGSFVNGCSAN